MSRINKLSSRAKLQSVSSPKAQASLAVELTHLREELTRFLNGKEALVETLLCGVLSSGHLLLEDVPGIGKTLTIKALAKLLGLKMKRIQCTSDLLPSDILGVEVFDAKEQEFVFHRGPIFANLVLADELNRASPRTQSALLEAMGEGFVTIDRKTYPLPKPFFVFAAQNPSDFVGTYELPESQTDRFSAKFKLSYPADKKEIEIFSQSLRDPLEKVPAQLLTPEQLLSVQENVEKVFISERIAQYAKRFVDQTRHHQAVKLGISTRGGVSWLRMARARAYLNGRNFVLPEDMLELAIPCLAHRLITHSGLQAEAMILEIQKAVDIE